MSHFSKIFNRVPVKVPNRSGFDKSCERIGSAQTGTLIPVLCDEILPNTTIRLGALAQVQLPPMATDFYGRIDAKLEAFFVPGRLLYGGFEDVFTHETGDTSALPSGYYPQFIPGAQLTHATGSATQYGPDPNQVLKAGTLADYLGIKVNSNPAVTTISADIDNILPFVCYHLIWSTWYRDARIQVDPFSKQSFAHSNVNFTVANLPYVNYITAVGSDPHFLVASSTYPDRLKFNDGVDLFTLRQRNFGKDRFTVATPLPQAGAPSTLTFAVSGGTGAFTIPSLRAANALQQWLEMNNVAGARYGDQQKAEFGVYPESFKCDRPIYLGSKSISIYNRTVYKSTSIEEGSSSTPVSGQQNPFQALGTKAADASGFGDGMLVEGFRATERGYLMVMFSIVPHAYYSTGVDPMFWRYRVGDFAHPLMQGVGDEPIFREEVGEANSVVTRANLNTFGYTQRYSAYKYKEDTVSGLLRDYMPLTAFALKRSFVALATTINTAFLEIPYDFLDQVTAVNNYSSNYGAWYDIYFNYKAAMPLSAYTIPTLGNMEDTHTEVVNNGGTRL